MSTGYSWKGALLGARHVPERLCGFLLGALCQVLDLLRHFIPILHRMREVISTSSFAIASILVVFY